MSERDPRTDPKPGDVISRGIKQAKQGTIIREVTRAHGGFVFFVQDNGYLANPKLVSIDQWRKWAKNAEVINRAE